MTTHNNYFDTYKQYANQQIEYSTNEINKFEQYFNILNNKDIKEMINSLDKSIQYGTLLKNNERLNLNTYKQFLHECVKCIDCNKNVLIKGAEKQLQTLDKIEALGMKDSFNALADYMFAEFGPKYVLEHVYMDLFEAYENTPYFDVIFKLLKDNYKAYQDEHYNLVKLCPTNERWNDDEKRFEFPKFHEGIILIKESILPQNNSKYVCIENEKNIKIIVDGPNCEYIYFMTKFK